MVVKTKSKTLDMDNYLGCMVESDPDGYWNNVYACGKDKSKEFIAAYHEKEYAMNLCDLINEGLTEGAPYMVVSPAGGKFTEEEKTTQVDRERIMQTVHEIFYGVSG